MTLLLLFFAIVASAAASPTTLPIEIRDNFPILIAVINDIEVPLKFDLGDGDTLVLQPEVLDQAKAVATGESVKMMGLNGPFEAPLFRVPRIRIGDLVFTDVVARLDRRDDSYVPGASGEKGYLGTGLLKSHVVVIDYPRRTMTLLASESAAESRDRLPGNRGSVFIEMAGRARHRGGNGLRACAALVGYRFSPVVPDPRICRRFQPTRRGRDGRKPAGSASVAPSSGPGASTSGACRRPDSTGSWATTSSPATSCVSIFRASDW